ncbi:MAG: hypothetical protein Q4F83_11010 [Eubacteriales bacterium]|nr:hypothetical protein [Eubacteriales bacterium]
MIRIAEDKGQHQKKHQIKQQWFADNGIDLVQLPLPVGDYILLDERVQEVVKRRGDKLKKMDLLGVTRISVDTKKDLGEVASNICGKSHPRFRDECILAQQNGIKLIVLVEHSRFIKSLEDVEKWTNPRWYGYCKKYGISIRGDVEANIAEFVSHGGTKPPVRGEQLAKAMRTMSEKYGIIWRFCDKKDTGRVILDILTGGDANVTEKTA